MASNKTEKATEKPRAIMDLISIYDIVGGSYNMGYKLWDYLTQEEQKELLEADKEYKQWRTKVLHETEEETGKKVIKLPGGEEAEGFRETAKKLYYKARGRLWDDIKNDKEKLKKAAAEHITGLDYATFSFRQTVLIMDYLQDRDFGSWSYDENREEGERFQRSEASPEQLELKKAELTDYKTLAESVIDEAINKYETQFIDISEDEEEALKEWTAFLQPYKAKKVSEWVKEARRTQKQIEAENKKTPEQIARVPILNKPDKLKILVSSVKDNLIQSNLDFLKLPVDGQQTFFEEENRKGRKVEERPAKHKNEYGKTVISKPIYSRVYMTTEKGVTLDKELLKVDDTDLTIFTHVITLLAYGNYEMTAEQIYQQMFQKENTITPYWEKRIDLFFRRLSSRRFGIIYDELVEAGIIPETEKNIAYLKKGSWEEQLLVYGKEKYINKRGKESYKYIIRDMPFIYVYSDWRDLIISVDISLLTAGAREKSNTEDTNNIRHYLLMRIGKAKRKKAKKTLKPSDTTILIDTLLNKSLSPFEIIDRGEGKPKEIKAKEVSRQKKSEALDIARAILEDLKQRGEIKSYSRPKGEGRGGKYEKIIFEL